MPNDFLSSLASKALQNTEVDSAAGGLAPRLASRFETPERPIFPAADQATETEEFIEVENRQKPGARKTAPAPGREQPETEEIQPQRSERGPSNAMALLRPRSDEDQGFVRQAPSPVASKYPEPILGVIPPAVPPIRVVPTSAARVELSDLSKKSSLTPAKDESAMLPPTAPRSHAVSTDPESHQTRALAKEISPQSPMTESTTFMPASVPPVAQPANERKVIPERIEVIRGEPRPLTSVNSPQIVPFVTLPELKPRRSAPEAQEQPPTIQVTIGRIEVKAATSGPPQKHRSSASATMSLEEYLRRRQRGER